MKIHICVSKHPSAISEILDREDEEKKLPKEPGKSRDVYACVFLMKVSLDMELRGLHPNHPPEVSMRVLEEEVEKLGLKKYGHRVKVIPFPRNLHGKLDDDKQYQALCKRILESETANMNKVIEANSALFAKVMNAQKEKKESSDNKPIDEDHQENNGNES